MIGMITIQYALAFHAASFPINAKINVSKAQTIKTTTASKAAILLNFSIVYSLKMYVITANSSNLHARLLAFMAHHIIKKLKVQQFSQQLESAMRLLAFMAHHIQKRTGIQSPASSPCESLLFFVHG
jgi:predicted histidine transporter YuiF (NhaC family)